MMELADYEYVYLFYYYKINFIMLCKIGITAIKYIEERRSSIASLL